MSNQAALAQIAQDLKSLGHDDVAQHVENVQNDQNLARVLQFLETPFETFGDHYQNLMADMAAACLSLGHEYITHDVGPWLLSVGAAILRRIEENVFRQSLAVPQGWNFAG